MLVPYYETLARNAECRQLQKQFTILQSDLEGKAEDKTIQII